jgi:hypothetical protein
MRKSKDVKNKKNIDESILSPLLQKVICPNCRYAFQIVKENLPVDSSSKFQTST